jgi:PAS domain S-box-containing protein
MLVLFEGKLGARQTQRFIEEMLNVGHWSWDLNSGHMEWSRGLYDLLGADSSSVVASSIEFDKVIHPDDRHFFADAEQMLRQSIGVEREFRIVSSSGRLRWIMLRAEPIASNLRDPSRAVGICHDITRHREDLLLLQQNEQRLKAIAQLSSVLSWVAKPDGALIEFLNLPDALRIKDFVVRPSWTRLVHPDDAENFQEAWRKGIETRQRISLEHRMLASDGSYFPCWSVGSPSFDGVGTIKEWIGISKNLADLSDRPQKQRGPITAPQIRAARAILTWSVERLSQESGVRPGTIRRLEEFEGSSASDAAELAHLERTLTAAGIDFVVSSEGRPGLRPR